MGHDSTAMGPQQRRTGGLTPLNRAARAIRDERARTIRRGLRAASALLFLLAPGAMGGARDEGCTGLRRCYEERGFAFRVLKEITPVDAAASGDAAVQRLRPYLDEFHAYLALLRPKPSMRAMVVDFDAGFRLKNGEVVLATRWGLSRGEGLQIVSPPFLASPETTDLTPSRHSMVLTILLPRSTAAGRLWRDEEVAELVIRTQGDTL